MINFELIFMCYVRQESKLIILHVLSSCPSTICRKDHSFSHWIFLAQLLKTDRKWEGFISGHSILFHWSICLSLCQYHTDVWFIYSPAVSFKIRKCESCNFVLFFEDVVTIPQFHKGLLCFHIHFSISLSISALLPAEGSCDFDMNCIESIDKFESLAF